MKVFKIIAKLVLAIAAVTFLGGSNFSGDPLGAIVFFAACYGLVTWYMFSFSNSDGFLVGDGLISMAIAMVINLGLPVLILAAPILTMQTFLPEGISKIGQIIYGIILTLACLYCMFGDFIHVARVLKPDFLGNFGDIFDINLDLND